MRSHLLGLAVITVVAQLTSLLSVAEAGDKDLVLRRLAERVPVDENGNQTTEAEAFGFNAVPDEDAFRSLSRDMGLIFVGYSIEAKCFCFGGLVAVLIH
ncbi:MAG: hypothetical protein AAFS10_27000, partial [Myxococcota bacterium]